MDTREQQTGIDVAGRKRRRYTSEYKRRIVEETLDGKASVSVVARRHDLNANQLFNWRRRYLQGELAASDPQFGLVPVRLATAEPGHAERVPQGELELRLAGGHRVSVRGAVDKALLRVTLEVLSR